MGYSSLLLLLLLFEQTSGNSRNTDLNADNNFTVNVGLAVDLEWNRYIVDGLIIVYVRMEFKMNQNLLLS